MAGHSHSANVKHRKDRVNAAKAKVFSKIAKMIIVAAKLGGGDPDANPRLRLAVEKARAASMPKDNIERAIKRATGEQAGANYEELIYEGYGPGGVAVMVEILTDNRNRTAPEVRKIFERTGGNIGAGGSVSWMFERKAVFAVDPDAGQDEDTLTEAVLESGAEDLLGTDGLYEIHCEPGDFLPVKSALEEHGVKLSGAEVGYVPTNKVDVTELEVARKVLRLMEGLEDHDDIQGVHANYNLTPEVARALAEEM
ncbi:MAG: YebC/PmpR family DNA-binding transcriptional regulator [Planctomycetota bacterium]|jgi:YebC/PmpR family DNA-binding regulatory protein